MSMSAQNNTLIIPVTTLQNVTVNTTMLQNVTTYKYNTTTKKNDTIVTLKNVTVPVNVTRNVTKNITNVVFNQTLYTIAVYWNNFGLTDYQKAEYEITLFTNLPQSN